MNKRVSHALDGKVASNEEADKPKTLSEPPKLGPPPPTSSTTSERKESISQETSLTIEEIEAILNSKIEFCKENNLSVLLNYI